MNLESNRAPVGRCVLRTVFLVLLLVLFGCKEELYTGLEEHEANDMLSILMRNGISSKKVKEPKSGSYSIHVVESQFPKAIELLKARSFPREKFLTVDELFSKKGLISSPLEERVRYIYALSQDVQETLARIDGVLTARVHVVLPENNPFSDDVKPSSASVFIKYVPGIQLEDIKSEIKLIVEKSIEGLTYDKVSVIMLPAQRIEQQEAVQWDSVLGIRLPTESVFGFSLLVWTLAALLVLFVGAIAYLVWLLYQWNDDSEEEDENTIESRPGQPHPSAHSNQTKGAQIIKLLQPRNSPKNNRA